MEEGEDDHTSRQGPLFLHVSYFIFCVCLKKAELRTLE